MDGSDKLKPIVIGKYQNPRCMKNVDRSKLGCEYYATHKAWMTGELFQRIIRDLNSRCKKQSRRCVLLVDGAGLRTEKCRSYILLIVFVSGAHCVGSHVLEEGFELTLSNLKVIWFPANCTSVMQHLDQGIIHSTKCCYRHLLCKYILSLLDAEEEFDSVCSLC